MLSSIVSYSGMRSTFKGTVERTHHSKERQSFEKRNIIAVKRKKSTKDKWFSASMGASKGIEISETHVWENESVSTKI